MDRDAHCKALYRVCRDCMMLARDEIGIVKHVCPEVQALAPLPSCGPACRYC